MILLIAGLAGLVALYMWRVNAAMKVVPEEAQNLSPRRWTVEEIKAAYKKSLEAPIDVTKSLPPKQSRRYVIVGGTGLVGAWIVSHLLARGEDPKAIRILDIISPEQDILNKGVGWIKTNITDELAVTTAFEEPWAANVTSLPLTVCHTAAIIRPQDRLKSLLPLSSKVNIDGTRNVLNAAKAAGATAFIWTSSGSIALHRPTFWIAPWATQPKHAVQVISDSTKLPQSHNQFFSNYAVTKTEAERLVRAADNPATNFRTGCIRPTNGVYGTGGQANNVMTGLYLQNGGSPTWARPILQSFVHAENVSIAHLLYEQRLIQQSEPGSQLPNTGGQAFIVSDPNPAIAFDDLYTLLTMLSKTPVSFPDVPAVPLLAMAYLVEMYAFLQYRYFSWLPRLSGDIAQLQPSVFSIVNVHVFADDSRAKLAPEMGGLGYNPPLNTLDGLCRRLVDWNTKEGKDIEVMENMGPVKGLKVAPVV
ncbi:3-beta hydroxysteroid dehydrogenase/isomerase [Penicillium cf. griseofulvum]|uniref:3-beta hydroxysteroid dehydrogenase/isomerase n=1 Tax=Penicillium cf. griseofulvum TaxID=2972120 RepID=A0A9W9IZJ7_9EURO|nr:3-beta hydroxysteroid dehydrogenase/isomerase [Penicillium cf. griseofulvum]KAJ5430389.1 3-beta hydroxysteroid dehydrogenase/isomerase [Penicillium cf. griseofulvum]KAJ5435841.1 3-beta hydroxysteroid dehydrogenase/isomerase [Penicillium cf. griseofulvum]